MSKLSRVTGFIILNSCLFLINYIKDRIKVSQGEEVKSFLCCGLTQPSQKAFNRTKTFHLPFSTSMRDKNIKFIPTL